MRKVILLFVILGLLLPIGCGGPSNQEIIEAAKDVLLNKTTSDGKVFFPEERTRWVNERIYKKSGDFYMVYFVIEEEFYGDWVEDGWMVVVDFSSGNTEWNRVGIPPDDYEVGFLMGLSGWPGTE